MAERNISKMRSLADLKRVGYRLQRAASLGAQVTLLSGCGYHSALFECATHVAAILGDRNLSDLGDGIEEIIPVYRIPNDELNDALLKLSKHFSIALVEYAVDKLGRQFIGLWRINRVSPSPLSEIPSANPDDY